MKTNTSWQTIKHAGYRTGLYQATLRGKVPDHLRFVPVDPWPGDMERANELFQGRFRFCGREARAPNQPPWRLRPDDVEWQSQIHRFDWLRHFAVTGGDTARAYVQRLLLSWLELYSDLDTIAWAADTLGRRVVNWTMQSEFLLSGADPVLKQRFFDNLATQWRHLLRCQSDCPAPAAAFDAALGAVYGALTLPGEESKLARQLAAMAQRLDVQVLRDGGYVTRNPFDLLSTLRDLCGLRDGLKQIEADLPDWLTVAIGRMAAALQSIRAGDGALPVFHGGGEADKGLVNRTLGKAGRIGGRKAQASGDYGFQRLAAGDALILVDAGPPAAGDAGLWAHASCGSFEFYLGGARVVCNCGSGRDRGGDWRHAMRQWEAHSIASLESAPVWEPAFDGGFMHRADKPRSRLREDEDGNQWLELHQAGHQGRSAPQYIRRLFLDTEGNDLRGQDGVHLPDKARRYFQDDRFIVRFHLHPGVQCSMVQGGDALLLKLPNRAGLRFQADGGEMTLEESIYLGQAEGHRRCQQIVVRAAIEDAGASVRWAFRRT
jgi:uncharacterized heparinase superfamily protein